MSGHLHTLKFVFLCLFVVLCIFQSLYVLPDTFPNLLTCVLRWRRCGQAWLPPLCYVPYLCMPWFPPLLSLSQFLLVQKCSRLPQCPTCHIAKCYAGDTDPLVMVPVYCIFKSSPRLKRTPTNADVSRDSLTIRAREMAQLLRTLPAPAEDLNSVLSVHIGQLTNTYNSSSRECGLFWPPWAPVGIWCSIQTTRHTHMHKFFFLR